MKALVRTNTDARLLAVGQALTSTVLALLTAVASLAGVALAPVAALGTLPVAGTVAGTLVMIYPAAVLMQRVGRRLGFATKAALGIGAGALCATAMWQRNFALLTIGSFLFGLFAAFGQYFRFAALETSGEPTEQIAALSLVTAAGAAGGVLGPYLANRANAALPDLPPFAGAYLAAIAICIALAVSQSFLSPTLGRGGAGPTTTHRTARRDLGPRFYRASLVCAVGYAVMTLSMVAAPLSMSACGFGTPLSDLVLQVHFAAMYLPSLAHGWLLRHLSVERLVGIGIVASTTSCLVALWPAQGLNTYLVELALSGLGWNLMFNGGTLLLARTYPPHAKTFAQGVNSLLVYGANVAAALFAGAGMAFYGWAVLNAVGLPMLLCASIVMRRAPRCA